MKFGPPELRRVCKYLSYLEGDAAFVSAPVFASSLGDGQCDPVGDLADLQDVLVFVACLLTVTLNSCSSEHQHARNLVWCIVCSEVC